MLTAPDFKQEPPGTMASAIVGQPSQQAHPSAPKKHPVNWNAPNMQHAANRPSQALIDRWNNQWAAKHPGQRAATPHASQGGGGAVRLPDSTIEGRAPQTAVAARPNVPAGEELPRGAYGRGEPPSRGQALGPGPMAGGGGSPAAPQQKAPGKYDYLTAAGRGEYMPKGWQPHAQAMGPTIGSNLTTTDLYRNGGAGFANIPEQYNTTDPVDSGTSVFGLGGNRPAGPSIPEPSHEGMMRRRGTRQPGEGSFGNRLDI